MSVLIKNMTLPATCSECVIEQHDENYYGAESNYRCPFIRYGYTEKVRETDVLFDCPLVKVPPHGRLIDADALNLDYEVEMADHWKTAHEMANIVKYAPTIIEAEGEA